MPDNNLAGKHNIWMTKNRAETRQWKNLTKENYLAQPTNVERIALKRLQSASEVPSRDSAMLEWGVDWGAEWSVCVYMCVCVCVCVGGGYGGLD